MTFAEIYAWAKSHVIFLFFDGGVLFLNLNNDDSAFSVLGGKKFWYEMEIKRQSYNSFTLSVRQRDDHLLHDHRRDRVHRFDIH